MMIKSSTSTRGGPLAEFEVSAVAKGSVLKYYTGSRILFSPGDFLVMGLPSVGRSSI